MEITNELLAAYAEGNVTPEERKEVREFLTEHPSQLESVMMMMDEDYGIEKVSHKKGISFKGCMDSKAMVANSLSACAAESPLSGIATGATVAYYSLFEKDSSALTAPQTFNDRLDDLLDEIY